MRAKTKYESTEHILKWTRWFPPCFTAPDPLMPYKKMKSEGLIMLLKLMGVTVTVYGSKIVTFKPVDCLISSVMIAKGIGIQM